jgi:hypothetical protein
MSQEKATLAGQDHLYDITTFDGWVGAKVSGRDKLAAFYERRFRPEYATAFSAWLKLDPINNPSGATEPDLHGGIQERKQPRVYQAHGGSV